MFKYKEEYSWLTNICLNITDACPLFCIYCFVEQHPHYMTLDTAKSAVNFILQNLEKKRKNNPEERASITYFGGEPTIMWDEIIVPLTNWVKKNDYPIDFTITTNGVLLNKERIQFLKDNNIVPLLSIDGNRTTQDYNRPRHDGSGSFDAVSAIIPDLLEAFPNTTFRATIWPETAHYTFENYMFAIQQGFKNVFFIPDYRHPWTEEQKQLLWENVDYIYNYMEYCFNNSYTPIGNSLIEDSFRHMLQHDLAIFRHYPKIKKEKHFIQRCGLGTSQGAIAYDGKIYGCQEQPSKDNKNIFLIGDLQNGIDKKKHKKLLKTFAKKSKSKCEEKNKCKNCNLQYSCYKLGCPSSNYDLFKDFHTHSQIECEWKQKLLFNSIQLNNLMVKQKNQNFKNFLDDSCLFKYFRKEDEE